jgi:hypothetical protein
MRNKEIRKYVVVDIAEKMGEAQRLRWSETLSNEEIRRCKMVDCTEKMRKGRLE